MPQVLHLQSEEKASILGNLRSAQLFSDEGDTLSCRWGGTSNTDSVYFQLLTCTTKQFFMPLQKVVTNKKTKPEQVR